MYYCFSTLLLDAFDRKPKMFQGDAIPIPIFVHGFSEISLQRKRVFNQYNEEFKESKSKLDYDSPYYGFPRYRYSEQDPLDSQKQTDTTFIYDILKYRLLQESKINYHLACIDLLERTMRVEKTNPKYILMLSYSLAQHYFLNSKSLILI
jgi:hypothetical protein